LETSVQATSTPSCALWQLVLYMLRLGTLGFGGPVALVGYMHRDLVEDRKWITEADYKEGLALAQLSPGPLAAQLAIYIGYVHHRIFGATLAGLAFVIPSFFMVLALGWALCTLWWFSLDAGGVLWRWRRSHWHHRDKRKKINHQKCRQGQIAPRDLPVNGRPYRDH
jgi:hypothetical protein